MNPRIRRLRQESVETPATPTIERALIETAFYKENYGKYPVPILRARNFYEICAKKAFKQMKKPLHGKIQAMVGKLVGRKMDKAAADDDDD